MLLCHEIHQKKMLRRQSSKVFSKHVVSTSIDPVDIKSVEILVRNLDKGTGVDDLMSSLSKIYKLFSPTEYTMRCLSLMYQQLYETGNLHEFCVVCVYTAAMESLMTKLPPKIYYVKSECYIERKMVKNASCWF